MELIQNAEIEKLVQGAPGYVAHSIVGELSARYVVLATGLVDTSPPLAGLEQAIDKGAVRYCPICDGYEASDQRIGVLGSIDDACGKALFLRGYSKHVNLLSLNSTARTDAACASFPKPG